MNKELLDISFANNAKLIRLKKNPQNIFLVLRSKNAGSYKYSENSPTYVIFLQKMLY